MSIQSTRRPPLERFRHEALLYSSDSEFLAGTVPFLEEGIAAGEAILVVVPAEKIALLRAVLATDADAVRFEDMAAVGANPALIIPAWRAFTDLCIREGRGMRGIGEPVYKGRRPAELAECQRHEVLLNLAFDRGAPWWLLCPYDISKLGPAVVDEARRSHPYVREAALGQAGTAPAGAALHEDGLPPPPAKRRVLPFTVDQLDKVRSLVGAEARREGLDPDRIAGVVLAANEVATNSLKFGGELSVLRIWTDDGALVCEISDHGHIASPLVDRQRPASDVGASRGLWLANHVCDLVQIHSQPGATTVRLHMWLKPRTLVA